MAVILFILITHLLFEYTKSFWDADAVFVNIEHSVTKNKLLIIIGNLFRLHKLKEH